MLRVAPEHPATLRLCADYLFNLLKMHLSLIKTTQRQQIVSQVQAGIAFDLKLRNIGHLNLFKALRIPHDCLLIVLEFAVDPTDSV